jgi:hypothetical protein
MRGAPVAANHRQKSPASPRTLAKRQPGATTKPPTKRQRLQELEQGIAEAQKRYDFFVGTCLREIHDSTLYETTVHRTWDEYLRKRWNYSRSYAKRLMDAVETEERLQRALTEAAGQAGTDVANRQPREPNQAILKNEWEARQVRAKLPFVVERVKAGDDPREAITKTVREVEEEREAKRPSKVAPAESERHEGIRAPRRTPKPEREPTQLMTCCYRPSPAARPISGSS